MHVLLGFSATVFVLFEVYQGTFLVVLGWMLACFKSIPLNTDFRKVEIIADQ